MNAWLSKLESSSWLDYVQSVLSTACFITQCLDTQGIDFSSIVVIQQLGWWKVVVFLRTKYKQLRKETDYSGFCFSAFLLCVHSSESEKLNEAGFFPGQFLYSRQYLCAARMQKSSSYRNTCYATDHINLLVCGQLNQQQASSPATARAYQLIKHTQSTCADQAYSINMCYRF